MRSAPLTFASVLVLGASVGCSETPAPVAPTVTNAPAQPTQVAVTPADLTPVAEPADLFIVARWKSPNATVSGLSACAGMPEGLAVENARRLVDRALAQAFRGGPAGKQLAEIVALDAPVDLVAALDSTRRTPQAFVSFSIGLTSYDRAKQAIGELVEVAPGLFRVGTKESGDLTCVVGAATGSAPARLICGPRDKDITALGPYLARNLPVAEPPKDDLHAEIRVAPLEARYGGDLRRIIAYLPNYARTRMIGEPRFDDALEAGASALADEGAALVGDLDRVSIDLAVDPQRCLTAKAALQLRGNTSWLAGTIAEGADQAGPPPAIFWHAPVDSEIVTYGRSGDPARYAGIVRTLRGLLEGRLAADHVGTDADRKALAGLIDLPTAKGTSTVFAVGHGPSRPLPAGKPTDQQLAEHLTNEYFGWFLFGAEESPEKLAKLLKDAVAVYGRKSLVDPIRQEASKHGDLLPTAKIVAAPRELGKGALDVEIKLEAEARPGEKPVVVTAHVLLMADGKTTWMAAGADRADLVKHLLAVKGGAPESGTIAARPGLEPIRAGKAVSSGFLTLGLITRRLSAALHDPDLRQMPAGTLAKVEEAARTLDRLPHKGETPIFVTSAAASGAAPRSELSLQVQKGSIEDLGTLVLTGLRLANVGSLSAAKP